MFSKNRDRLLEHQVIRAFFTDAIGLSDKQGLLSRGHFSVDGTPIQARVSHKGLTPNVHEQRARHLNADKISRRPFHRSPLGGSGRR